MICYENYPKGKDGVWQSAQFTTLEVIHYLFACKTYFDQFNILTKEV